MAVREFTDVNDGGGRVGKGIRKTKKEWNISIDKWTLKKIPFLTPQPLATHIKERKKEKLICRRKKKKREIE